MNSAYILAAAQVGTDLLGALLGASVTDKAARVASEFAQDQIRLRSNALARVRNFQMFDTLGAQQAALAASGVGGGRTSRLLEAQARRRASISRQFADVQTSSQLLAAELREDLTQAGAAQSVFDALGEGAIGLFDVYQKQQEQKRARTGGKVERLPSGPVALPSNPGGP